jgi:hypothetical protein
VARLHNLHDSDSNGVEAKKSASISLVSNLPILDGHQENTISHIRYKYKLSFLVNFL